MIDRTVGSCTTQEIEYLNDDEVDIDMDADEDLEDLEGFQESDEPEDGEEDDEDEEGEEGSEDGEPSSSGGEEGGEEGAQCCKGFFYRLHLHLTLHLYLIAIAARFAPLLESDRCSLCTSFFHSHFYAAPCR